jgi:hypothetical protein
MSPARDGADRASPYQERFRGTACPHFLYPTVPPSPGPEKGRRVVPTAIDQPHAPEPIS